MLGYNLHLWDWEGCGSLRLFSMIGGLGLRAEAWGSTCKMDFPPIEPFRTRF